MVIGDGVQGKLVCVRACGCVWVCMWVCMWVCVYFLFTVLISPRNADVFHPLTVCREHMK